MKQSHKLSTIAMLAVVIGIITIGPAMADKDSSEGHNKIDICHFDKEDEKFVKISIPENKAKGHAKNHVNDIIPAPDEGCSEQEESETETPSDESVDMDFILEDLSKHHEMLAEITDSQCSLGEVVTGFSPNGELLCIQDDTGEDNQLNIVSRSDVVDLLPGKSLLKEYSCEYGEILVGGLIDVPEVNTPLIINGIMVTNSEQTYVASINKNNNAETVPVQVTYLCFVI